MSPILQFFTYEHLPSHLVYPSRLCAELAREMEASLLDGPEKSAGLRKLLEAKDCFVRAQLLVSLLGSLPGRPSRKLNDGRQAGEAGS